MTPIPDVPVDHITTAEARRLADFQQTACKAPSADSPPSASRSSAPSRRHKKAGTASQPMSASRHIRKCRSLAGPTCSARPQPTRVAPIKGDVVSLEVVLDALGEPMHLFGGLRDFRSPLVVRQGEVTANQSPTEFIRAYIGGWPKPHLIDRFVRIPEGPLDADNIGRTGWPVRPLVPPRRRLLPVFFQARYPARSRLAARHGRGQASSPNSLCLSTTCTTNKSPPPSTASATCEPATLRPAPAAS